MQHQGDPLLGGGQQGKTLLEGLEQQSWGGLGLVANEGAGELLDQGDELLLHGAVLLAQGIGEAGD
ncbi:hypothetical protein D3C80_1853910 [compost metagenome]